MYVNMFMVNENIFMNLMIFYECMHVIELMCTYNTFEWMGEDVMRGRLLDAWFISLADGKLAW